MKKSKIRSLKYISSSATMVWPFSSAKAPAPGSVQLEQQSHRPLNIAPPVNVPGKASNDISNTLNQISTDNGLQVKELQTDSAEQTNKAVGDFVHQRPKNVFIIDGEKYSAESIICTNNEQGGKTCLKLKYNSIQLFKQMQKLDYFCSLPDDIDATYFECRQIT